MSIDIFSKIRHLGAKIIGRERANRLSAPFYDWLARRQTARFLANLNQKDLLVNIGCGYRHLAGWVNVDIARGYADVVWDIRKELPFDDQSCAAIFCEHVIEHLSKGDGIRLLHEFHRVLQSGGVVRISTPDAGNYLRSYVNNDGFLDHPRFSEHAASPMDKINKMMRENGHHLWVYDSETLRRSLTEASFVSVAEQRFGISIHPNLTGVDAPEREFESLYIEAVR